MKSKLQNEDRLVRGSVVGIGGGVTQRDWLQAVITCTSYLHEIVDKPATAHFLSLLTSALPCRYHSTIAPYSFIHLPRTLYNVFLPVVQFSPVSIIPPLLHTHSFIYHPRCIMFISQYFSFPLSVSFHHCSIHIHSSTTHAV